MHDPFINALRDWQTFYLLLGSAAAVLIGLLFVAISLAVDLAIDAERASLRGFVTPAVVQFTLVLFVAAVCVMPLQQSGDLGVLILLLGGASLLDAGVTLAALWRQWRGRLAEGQDWIWRVALPVATSLALSGSGVGLLVGVRAALFWLAGGTLVLLAMAIRNAWDLVTWIVAHRNDPRRAGAGGRGTARRRGNPHDGP
jgi:hypothetical protein